MWSLHSQSNMTHLSDVVRNVLEASHSLQNNTSSSANTTHTFMVTTKVNFLPLGLAILTISLCGIVANGLSVLVLIRPRMHSTYSYITLCLIFSDIVFLVTKLLRYGFQSMFTYFNIFKGYTGMFYPFAGPALRALTCLSHTGSTYFTIAVAIDRYLVVCWPLKSRGHWTIRRSIYLSIGVFVFANIFNFTRWWEFETVTMFDKRSNTTYYEMKSTAFRRNRNYRTPYKIVHLFIMNFIPFFVLSYLNLAIWRTLQQAQKRKESLTSVQRKEKSFAMMLMSVVVLFLACSSVYFVRDIVELVRNSEDQSVWDSIGNFLLTFNCAANFILYCLFGARFRQEFINVYKENLSCCYHRCVLWEKPKEMLYIPEASTVDK